VRPAGYSKRADRSAASARAGAFLNPWTALDDDPFTEGRVDPGDRSREVADLAGSAGIRGHGGQELPFIERIVQRSRAVATAAS
jgi:hypothetical protein